jgi:4-hydroxybenzoate polyprenyltransferase
VWAYSALTARVGRASSVAIVYSGADHTRCRGRTGVQCFAAMAIRSRVPALVRLVHPAPAAAVVALSAALAAILAADAGRGVLDLRVVLVVLSVAGSQVLTGALNDWADRGRDAAAVRDKPIPRGLVTPRAALALAAVGGMLQLAASLPLGALPLALGAIASGSAAAYNLWLSRTPASVLPYLVSFGALPAWIAAGVGVPLDRVAGAVLLVGPFAAAAHLANVLRDYEADRATGSRNFAQVLGRRRSSALAITLALAVGLGVGAALATAGRLTVPAALLGLLGLVAVAQGVTGPHRLWMGILVAAVCWTVAWALAVTAL